MPSRTSSDRSPLAADRRTCTASARLHFPKSPTPALFFPSKANPVVPYTRCSRITPIFFPSRFPMGREEAALDDQFPPLAKGGGGLVVGNYCHDVLFRDGAVVGEGLGGAASFLFSVLDPLSPCRLSFVSKVGPDFSYSVPHAPITCGSSRTTLFHAHFPSSAASAADKYHGDRVLRCVGFCEPILPLDLPAGEFEFGLAAGVAGEILTETLAVMFDLCRLMLVDVQGLIRIFDPTDGTVGLVPLRRSPFWELLPRIGFLKASAEEAPFVDVEEARKKCCVIVTEGKDGCSVYWKDGEVKVEPFPAVQVDPTGAGDSFLGGFVVGLCWGLTVPDAALLGNFFGALTIGQIGIPKFNHCLVKAVRQELERRGTQCEGPCQRKFSARYEKSVAHQEFKEFLIKVFELSHVDSSTELDDELSKVIS
ncbi:fructokinase [Apostasia shenzhenica]|uniref:Fructokinase n=1 Tax=Apostasia shenzhenica TaxID=1088818 RepID=A0A2I0A9T0_9ASPA|nr:fructokinase [Apostasia shenzhenica]